ncbi:hypothetical protein [Aurantimonas marina]|uniref:hypothetical protein n=1 Tax=Aurantimonas marina TaxID=2780508 RepID=UPI0019CF4C73|nr:hypothetical protein [Aurantimonas marina]
MTTGLRSFDNFSWASLLAGRDVLICDGDASRALQTAEALERAGARATIAESQRVALDRLPRRNFTLAVVALDGVGEVDAVLSKALNAANTKLLIMAEPARHPSLRDAEPRTCVVGLATSERQLVMMLTASKDE